MKTMGTVVSGARSSCLLALRALTLGCSLLLPGAWSLAHAVEPPRNPCEISLRSLMPASQFRLMERLRFGRLLESERDYFVSAEHAPQNTPLPPLARLLEELLEIEAGGSERHEGWDTSWESARRSARLWALSLLGQQLLATSILDENLLSIRTTRPMETIVLGVPAVRDLPLEDRSGSDDDQADGAPRAPSAAADARDSTPNGQRRFNRDFLLGALAEMGGRDFPQERSQPGLEGEAGEPTRLELPPELVLAEVNRLSPADSERQGQAARWQWAESVHLLADALADGLEDSPETAGEPQLGAPRSQATTLHTQWIEGNAELVALLDPVRWQRALLGLAAVAALREAHHDLDAGRIVTAGEIEGQPASASSGDEEPAVEYRLMVTPFRLARVAARLTYSIYHLGAAAVVVGDGPAVQTSALILEAIAQTGGVTDRHRLLAAARDLERQWGSSILRGVTLSDRLRPLPVQRRDLTRDYIELAFRREWSRPDYRSVESIVELAQRLLMGRLRRGADSEADAERWRRRFRRLRGGLLRLAARIEEFEARPDSGSLSAQKLEFERLYQDSTQAVRFVNRRWRRFLATAVQDLDHSVLIAAGRVADFADAVDLRVYAVTARWVVELKRERQRRQAELRERRRNRR